ALAGALSMALGLTACSSGDQPAAPTATTEGTAAVTDTSATAAADAAASNPFFAPSTLPLLAPDFRVIRDEHYLPALTEGMTQQLAEIDAIVNNPEPANLANTFEAMERSGALLTRTAQVFGNLAGTDT